MNLTLGRNLKEYRKRKGITQEDLAEYLGVTFQAVSRWERNEGYPEITILPEIADFFETTVDDLLGVNKQRNQQKIKLCLNKSAALYNQQDFEGAAECLMRGLKEFPHAYEIMAERMVVLQLLFREQAPDRKQEINWFPVK